MITKFSEVQYITNKTGSEYRFRGLVGEAVHIINFMGKSSLLYGVGTIRGSRKGEYRATVEKILSPLVMPVLAEFYKTYAYGVYYLDAPYVKLPIHRSQADWTIQSRGDDGVTVYLIVKKGKKFGKVRGGEWAINPPQVETPLTCTLSECMYI